MFRKQFEIFCVRIVATIFFIFCSTGVLWPATYYIDYNAAGDSANGTSKSASWKRHPYMHGFSGSYTHSAGDQFIFKGGVTWPSTCFQMTITAGGSVGHIDTYTVDKTWYSGGSWRRPVFDGEYATLGTGGNIVTIADNLSYITFDNLEVKRLNSGSNHHSGLFQGYGWDHVQFTNLYLHGWSLDNSITTDNAHGAINHYVGGSDSMTGVIVDNCIIENSEWTGIRQNGVAIRQVNTVRFSTLHDVSALVLFAGDFHDNLVYNIGYPSGNDSFDNTYHTNVLFLGAWNGAASPVGIPAYVYNNVYHDLGAATPAVYVGTGYDVTVYVYNNVVYRQYYQKMMISVETQGGSGDVVTVYASNNTYVPTTNPGFLLFAVDRGGDPRVKAVISQNNHGIGPTLYYASGPIGSSTADHNLSQTAAIATGEGYVEGNQYAPVSASGGTIDAGFSQSGVFTTDIDGVARPKGIAWDIGAYEYNSSGGSSEGIPFTPQGLRLK